VLSLAEVTGVKEYKRNECVKHAFNWQKWQTRGFCHFYESLVHVLHDPRNLDFT
jgi:hypothetical protein